LLWQKILLVILLTKAITMPSWLLTKILEGGDKMNSVDFSTNEKRKIDASEIVLFTVLGLCFAFMVLMIVMSFVAVNTHQANIFSSNLIKNFIYILITSVVLIVLDVLLQRGKLYAKDWLFSALYCTIFVLLNVLNIFDLYRFFVINLLANVIVGVMLTVVGVSIYYNYLKNENNKVKARAFVVVLFAFVFTIAGGFLLELVKYLSSLLFKTTVVGFSKVALNVAYQMIGSLALNIVFYLSLTKKKKVINACLIDVDRADE
jgi:hypothetical protein